MFYFLNTIIKRISGRYLRYQLEEYWYKSKKNIFQTKYKKKALFITLPITFHLKENNKWFNRDSLYERDRLIANHLNKKKYQVDIESSEINTNNFDKDYDLIINMNSNIQIFKNKENAKIIYLATTSYYKFNNQSEKKRKDRIKKKFNIELPLKRQINETNFEIYNEIFLIGNSFTKNTYPKIIQKKIKLMTNFPIEFSKRNILKVKRVNINQRKKNFLFLGSSKGAIHKGIDIAIETFSRLHDFNLFIFTKQKNDTEFFETYKNHINKNIHIYDFIDIKSEDFLEIALNCQFALSLSCSEGMSGSLLNVMSLGIIPIATKETGIELDKVFIVEDDINLLEKKIKFFNNLTNKEIHKLSERASKISDTKKREFIDSLEKLLQ